ncbi:hypothetical protein H0H92_015202 [Tricholoma furcatifolium]|nr:hypothetical protein H0H92_015202 [Tricholoma furcatifolium]
MIQNPENTIADSIRILSINGLFRKLDRYNYKARSTHAMTILASRLSQLTKIDYWDYIPRHIVEFFLSLQVAEFKIANALFRDPPSFSKLFQSPLIKGASNNLSLYHVRVIPAVSLAAHSHANSKQLNFSFIDEITLANFYQVWDLNKTRPQISIKSLCLAATKRFGVTVTFDFLITLSRYVGPSIKQLYVTIYGDEDVKNIFNRPLLSPSGPLEPSSDAGASITHSSSSLILNFPTLDLRTLIPKLFCNQPVLESRPVPPELIQAVIDNVDSHALLKLSLVSRYTSKRARIRLFHTLDFDHRKERYDVQENEDGTITRIRLAKCRFDRFLDMIQNPENTIAGSIRILSINGLFSHWTHCYDYKPRQTDAITILASRLSQLSSLRLKIDNWGNIPRHILEFFLRLRVAEVQIENALFFGLPSFSELFQSTLINGASNNLSLYCVRVSPVFAHVFKAAPFLVHR